MDADDDYFAKVRAYLDAVAVLRPRAVQEPMKELGLALVLLRNPTSSWFHAYFSIVWSILRDLNVGPEDVPVFEEYLALLRA